MHHITRRLLTFSKKAFYSQSGRHLQVSRLSPFILLPLSRGCLHHRHDAGADRLGQHGPDVLATRQVAWQGTSHEGRSPATGPPPCLSIEPLSGLAWPVTRCQASGRPKLSTRPPIASTGPEAASVCSHLLKATECHAARIE
jgi:hypothetical protein